MTVKEKKRENSKKYKGIFEIQEVQVKYKTILSKTMSQSLGYFLLIP
jgi:hypothetical protein